MATSAEYSALLRRHADASPKTQVLALLSGFPKSAHAVRSWLIAHGTVELRQIARDDAAWSNLYAAARKYRSKSQIVLRRDIARRSITHALRSYSCSPSRRRKASAIAAAAGAQMLAETPLRDTWLVNQRDLAVRLRITVPTVRAWLRIAVEEGVLKERARARDGRRRFSLRRWPASHAPSEVERLASASVERGEPNEVAAFILSVLHPAWAYDDDLGHARWAARVAWAAGERSRSCIAREAVAIVPFVDDLALRLDAIERFRVKWEVRETEAAERKASALESRALREKAYAALTAMSWPPKPGGLAEWTAQARTTLVRYPIPGPLVAAFNAALRRELTRRFPTEVEQTLTFLREDIFDDHNYAVH